MTENNGGIRRKKGHMSKENQGLQQLQLRFVLKINDLKSKVRRTNLNSVKSIKINSGRAILEFGAGDISPRSFTFGRAFHRPPKPPFS